MPELMLPRRARLHAAVARGLDFVWPFGAAWAYGDALRWAPHEPELHFRHGVALGRARRWHDAARALGSAVRLRPKDVEYRATRILALDRAGRVDELVVALRGLVALRPGEGELPVLLGAVLLRHGQRAEALKVFRWAVRLPPGHERRRFVLGEALLGPQRWEQALSAWQAARELDTKPAHPADPVEGRSVLHRHPGRRRDRASRNETPSRHRQLVSRARESWGWLGAAFQRSVVRPVAGNERERRVRGLRRAWHKANPRASRWPLVLLSLRRRTPDTSP